MRAILENCMMDDLKKVESCKVENEVSESEIVERTC